MARKKSFIGLAPPGLSETGSARWKPAREGLSPKQYAAVTGRGRPKAVVPKVPVTIRLDRDVVEAFKATGKGWQTKINDTLRRSIVTSRFAAARNSKADPVIAVEDEASAGLPRTVTLGNAASESLVAPRKAKRAKEERV